MSASAEVMQLETRPTPGQLRLIARLAAEVDVEPPPPASRAEASKTIVLLEILRDAQVGAQTSDGGSSVGLGSVRVTS